MAQSSRHKPRHHGRHIPLKPSGPWANGPIPVVGLVGGIGAGKSVAASALAGLGLLVLDADAIGHALLAQRPARDLILDRFGSRILEATPGEVGKAPEGIDEEDEQSDDGPRIDRRALGQIVFGDPAARRDLEAILHPPMRKTFERAIARAGRAKRIGVVLDAAILFEAGWNHLCDAVIFVDAPRELRLARLAVSRGWPEDVLDAREKAQAPLQEKRDRSDRVISNDGDPEALRSKLAEWWSSFHPSRDFRGRPRPPRPPR